MSLKEAIFLDRDGTVNVEKNYLYKIEDWEWIPGAKEAIKRFKNAGYVVIVVSNQAGVARGMYGCADVEKLHGFVNEELKKTGSTIDAFYFCPHHPEFGTDDEKNCACRKPKAGMLLRAAAEHGIDLSRSWMIGDKAIDVEAGLAAGVSSLLVKTGYGLEEAKKIANQEIVVADILAACDSITSQKTTHHEKLT